MHNQMNRPKEELRAELPTHLESLKINGILIIVEGKKDKAALKNLGLTNVTTLEGPLFENVERIVELISGAQKKQNKAVILTDLDPEGKKLYSRLKKDLGERGIEVDDRFREFLFRNTKLRQIEGIGTYLENLYG